MKKLVKIQNNKIISVFEGTDIDYAKQKGFEEIEVEQGYDSGWYIKGYAPQKSQELINQEKIAEYQKYLADTDYVVIKIVEAIVSGSKQLINELKNKYADVLTNRNNKRKQINEFEEEIKKIEEEKEEIKKQEEVIEQIQEKDIISIEEVDKIPENIDSDQVKVVDSIEIIPDQTEEQDKVMETMDTVKNVIVRDNEKYESKI